MMVSTKRRAAAALLSFCLAALTAGALPVGANAAAVMTEEWEAAFVEFEEDKALATSRRDFEDAVPQVRTRYK
jgi:hypothetical protein